MVIAYIICKYLVHQGVKLLEGHLVKLLVYELIWLFYWVGWCFIATANPGQPPGLLFHVGMLILGLILMPIYGVAYGFKLQITNSITKAKDWIPLTVNILILAGTFSCIIYAANYA